MDYRLDNLVHASACPEDADREIKLWFAPQDIPPLMRVYAVVSCESHYYYKDGQVSDTYQPGSLLLTAPGDEVWDTDLTVLRQAAAKESSTLPLNAVVAKYLINRSYDE